MREPRSSREPDVDVSDGPSDATADSSSADNGPARSGGDVTSEGSHPAGTEAPDGDRGARPTRRLRSVDAFRGIVLALMVLTPATGAVDQYLSLIHI